MVCLCAREQQHSDTPPGCTYMCTNGSGLSSLPSSQMYLQRRTQFLVLSIPLKQYNDPSTCTYIIHQSTFIGIRIHINIYIHIFISLYICVYIYILNASIYIYSVYLCRADIYILSVSIFLLSVCLQNPSIYICTASIYL